MFNSVDAQLKKKTFCSCLHAILDLTFFKNNCVCVSVYTQSVMGVWIYSAQIGNSYRFDAKKKREKNGGWGRRQVQIIGWVNRHRKSAYCLQTPDPNVWKLEI